MYSPYHWRLMFFDRDRIKKALDETTRKKLSRLGAYIRHDAKASMKKRKRAAYIYEPPSVHKGYLKKFLYFGYDISSRSVVVGSAYLPSKRRNDMLAAGKLTVPQMLEYGGNNGYKKNPRRLKRKIGDVAIVHIEKDGFGDDIPDNLPRYYRQVKDSHGHQRWVLFSHIKSAKQLSTVNTNEARLFGPMYIKDVTFPHPYMGPALEKEKALLGKNSFWQTVD